MMSGGSTRTRLPKLGQPNPYRNPKREERKKSVKRYYDKTAHDRSQLEQNQNVFFERKQMRNVSLVNLLPVFITKPTQFSQGRCSLLQESTTYQTNRSNRQKQLSVTSLLCVLKAREDKLKLRMRRKSQPVVNILTQKKLRIIPTPLPRPTYLVKTVTSWRIPCKKLLLMLNRQSSRDRKEPE